MFSSIFRPFIGICIVLLTLYNGTMARYAAKAGSIEGSIVNSTTHKVLPGASIRLDELSISRAADDSGTFVFDYIPPGIYTLKVSHVGYKSNIIGNIEVRPGEVTSIDIQLKEKPIRVKDISSYPGWSGMASREPVISQTLNRTQLESAPQLGDDLFRAAARLPGMVKNDFATGFSVRGGDFDEVLVSLDGLQLYNPFHLKDILGGAVSAVDAAAVDKVNLMTGAFPAKYGNRLSGVFDIQTYNMPPDEKMLTANANIMDAGAVAAGTSKNNKNSWLFSVRRGHVDYIVKRAGGPFHPAYYDLFGKYQYKISEDHILSFDLLHASDKLDWDGTDSDDGDTLKSKYSDTYFWVNMNSIINSNLSMQTVASVGKLEHNRRGQEYNSANDILVYSVSDKRQFSFTGLKTDAECKISDNVRLQFGYDLRRSEASYDYLYKNNLYIYYSTPDGIQAELVGVDTIQADLAPRGDEFGAYLSTIIEVHHSLILECGGRYDNTSYTGDKHFSSRWNLLYKINDRTNLHFGVGDFYQSQGIYNIPVGEGETGFHAAEKVRQYSGGCQYKFENGITMGLEGYYKKYSNLQPEYRNLYNNIEVFPEYESDRCLVFKEGRRARGIELHLSQESGSKFSWRASYALSQAIDDIDSFVFLNDNEDKFRNCSLPAPNDQRHTMYLDIAYTPSSKWQLNASFQYHTGRPYTDSRLMVISDFEGNEYYAIRAGDLMAKRFKDYHRLDLRVNRNYDIGKGKLTAYLEVLNAYSHENVRAYEYDFIYDETSGRYILGPDPEMWFTIIPVIGLSYKLLF